MSILNEPYELNEVITNDIEVTSSLFKKIYKFTEFHYGNVSKSFIYITIEIEFYENKNENNDSYNDSDHDNISVYTNISIDACARSTCFQDVGADVDADALNDIHMNADACSVNTTDSHFRAFSKNRKNRKIAKKKNINKNIKNIIKNSPPPPQEQVECLNNNDSISDFNHGPKNTIKPSLNFNKIKNIVNNVKTEARKKVKIVPIEKKINTIMEKITNKIQSEMMKEYINYKLILENSKKPNGSYIHKVNAFYHVLLNKIESSL
jgi:hypothetical protein